MIGNIGGNAQAVAASMFGSQSEEIRKKTLGEGRSGEARSVATGAVSKMQAQHQDAGLQATFSKDDANTLAAAQAQALQGASSAQA